MNKLVQEIYKPVVTAAQNWCLSRFDKRLKASFIAGSVALGEAMPNVSDLDYFIFIEAEPCRGDKISKYHAERRITHTFPFVPIVHLNLHSVQRLLNEPFWQFILTYNATQIAGEDVLNWCNTISTVKIPKPDAYFAQSRLKFVRTCLETALNGITPPSLDQLPDDTYLSARKLARNFVVVEGAYLLMSKGQFIGFGQQLVIDTLVALFPQWNQVLNISRSVLINPLQAGISASEYMRLVKPFVEWLLIEIEMCL